ncbi:EmrB/QacA subfamily drug resistance transporter [Oceaniovalibus guishaninsula JLT2003]|uniref:EmrB/QacA subfamily drug resistance transporter n=1 Tax=Oceaniovalibus guishaninsula JLT2003 TaxID=1231392 RepID=K2GJW7_9RHOB|nr:MDR family MFS transporter [Oceaniovalibus guishaninsula]EKE43071.1 EmrB/QacA subfamily drug resistance transporter [Oceaniovalibus guishaninsula JLT2003]
MDEAMESAGPRQGVRVVIGALMLVMLLSSLSQTIVSTALPTIVGELGGLDHLAWIVTAYMLAVTVVTPLYGKLGDMLGRKRMLQSAIVLFLVGSALCGLAQSTLHLILFRAVQGLGGGGLMVTSMAAVGDVVSPRERGRYQGWFGAVFGVSTVTGPLIGGYIVEHLTWRWIFYVNLPLGLLALAVISLAFAPPAARERRRIDWAGAVLLAAGLTALVLWASLGGNTLPWNAPPLWALAGIAAASLAALIPVERRAAEPILPPQLFANRTFVISSAVGFIVGLSMFAAITYMPVYLQVVMGIGPSLAGLALSPLMGGLFLTSIVSGRIISGIGRYRLFPIAGTALMAVGLGLLSLLTPQTSLPFTLGALAVLGLGLGMVMQVLVLAVQNAVEYRDLGVATSGATLFRSIGGALGVAGAGAIFAPGLAAGLAGLGADAPLATTPAQIAALPDAVRATYLAAYSGALHPVFLTAAALAALAFALSWALPELPLRETIDDAATAPDLGNSFAMPRDATSLDELRRIVANAASDANRAEAMRRIIAALDIPLSPSEAWLLLRIARTEGSVTPRALDGADAASVDPVAARLLARGLVERAPGGLCTTPAGRETVAALTGRFRARLSALVARWHPEEHEEVRAMLTDFARDLMATMPRPRDRPAG